MTTISEPRNFQVIEVGLKWDDASRNKQGYKEPKAGVNQPVLIGRP